MTFDPNLPKPYKENWREAYRYDNDDTPRLSSYQPPEGQPIPFVLDNLRLSGGQSVDTAEYPFFGYWSNTPLNEKTQTLSLEGFIRGETYIKNRNALIESLRVKTSDDAPGYIDLPLWGRFPVVVATYDIKEAAKENGQCAVSITLTRAGITIEERWQFDGKGFDIYGKTAAAATALQKGAVDNFAKTLADKADPGMLAKGFALVKDRLIAVVGRVQGIQAKLNEMTNKVVGITNLIAQGIRLPKDLALALIGAVGGIIAGIMGIKNSFESTVAFFTGSGGASGNTGSGGIGSGGSDEDGAGGIGGSAESDTAPAYFAAKDNVKNVLMQFLSEDTFVLDIEAVTVKEIATKEALKSLYRSCAYCAAGQLLMQLETPTYEQTRGYWALLQKLEAGIDQNNPDIYAAVQEMRLAASRELAARNLAAELVKTISLPTPLLYLSKYLGCDDEKLRQLNAIADSFVIRGDVIYV